MDSVFLYNLEYLMGGASVACLFAGVLVAAHRWKCRRAFR